MREILLLDVETSGLDEKKYHLLEVGLIRWSVEHCATIASCSWLVHAPENPAQAVNGIHPDLLSLGDEIAFVRDSVEAWAQSCQAIAAHNGDFDRRWVPDLRRPWIDTAWDVEWPKARRGGSSLVELCLAHGLAVLEAHRALADCQMIARLLERCAELGHDIGAMLSRAMRPKVAVEARGLPFERKEEAKVIGFRWDPEARVWWRRMFHDDVAALPFRVVTVQR